MCVGHEKKLNLTQRFRVLLMLEGVSSHRWVCLSVTSSSIPGCEEVHIGLLLLPQDALPFPLLF